MIARTKVKGGHPVRVLAVASGGGHWDELMFLQPAWSNGDVHYATTIHGLAGRAGLDLAYLVPDCNRNAKLKIARSALSLLGLLLRLRPDVVITTGALPGLLALILGKALGARTVWIDSVANAEEMSLAGLKARRHCDLWMTQSQAVAKASGAGFAGAVL